MGKPHHGGGGRRGRGRGGFGGSWGGDTTIIYDNRADDLCFWEKLPDGRIVRRCPTREAMGFLYSDAMGAGDLLPTFVLPDDARAYLDQTNAEYVRLSATIAASSAVTQDFKGSWSIQMAAWLGFYAQAKSGVGFFNSKAVMDQTDKFAQQAKDWNNAFLQAGGSQVGPAPQNPGQGTGEQMSLSSLLSGTTGVIVAGAALAAVFFLGTHSK